jgi:hypothetical protein
MQNSNGQELYPEEILEKLETILSQFNGIAKVSPRTIIQSMVNVSQENSSLQ